MVRIASIFVHVFLAGTSFAQDLTRSSTQGIDAAVRLLDRLERPKWTYSRLQSESDLIVVAKLISTSEFDSDTDSPFSDDAVQYTSNTVQVLTVLKGPAKDKIGVVTIRWNRGVAALANHEFAKLRRKLLLPNWTAPLWVVDSS